ncbi:MAG: lipopolysaccharide kinase InaA family protein [Thermoanaerobaculales bacterium]
MTHVEASVVIARVAPEWDRSGFRAWCENLEALAAAVRPEAVIYRKRNLIFRASIEGVEVAVKRFPTVKPAQRLIYRWRTTKAVRAFDHATRLLALGFGTPAPLAAVEVRRGAWPIASYFCSTLVAGFTEARTLRATDAADRPRLLALIGELIGRMHEAGVLHRDLTSGNILLLPSPASPGGVEFQLVDVNRMRFGRIGVPAGIANLVQLRLNDDDEVLQGYCRARRLDPTRLRRYYRVRLALRALHQTTKERTRPLRRRLGL